MNIAEISLIVGLDWADCEHVCCVREPAAAAGKVVRIATAPEAFGPWLDRLRQEHDHGLIAVVLERPNGSVVEMIQGRSGFVVVAVNPATLHRFRQAFVPSGAKDDPGDAALLAELLVRHPEKLTQLLPADPRVRMLDTLTHQRRRLVEQRTKLIQQLTNLLKDYFPQALELAGSNLSAPLAVEFLRRWPELSLLKRARWATVERFYRQHRCGRSEVLSQRRKLIAQAVPVSMDTGYLRLCRLQMETLLAQLLALIPLIERYDQEIAETYAQAPGRAVINSLPGAGPAMAPRLWVACAQAGTAPTAQDLAQLSGVAPVQRQSGKSRQVCFRRARPRFLHQSWREFALHSIAGSSWARHFYHSRAKAGQGRNAILRALAFKWTRIVARLWRDQLPYDEAFYLAHLKTRPSVT